MRWLAEMGTVWGEASNVDIDDAEKSRLQSGALRVERNDSTHGKRLSRGVDCNQAWSMSMRSTRMAYLGIALVLDSRIAFIAGLRALLYFCRGPSIAGVAAKQNESLAKVLDVLGTEAAVGLDSLKVAFSGGGTIVVGRIALLPKAVEQPMVKELARVTDEPVQIRTRHVEIILDRVVRDGVELIDLGFDHVDIDAELMVTIKGVEMLLDVDVIKKKKM